MPLFRKLKDLIHNDRHPSIAAEIEPDEIFLDSTNLPQYDNDQFEGRLEKPIGKKVILVLISFFFILISLYTFKLWNLQIKDGQAFADKSARNSLKNTLVFASRGVVDDRNGVPLIWNEPAPDENIFSQRKYTDLAGMSSLLGYLKYPQKDKSGNYYSSVYDPKDGVEKFFNDSLSGENGQKITEVDAVGNVQSESVIRPPKNGDTLTLSIDARLQSALFNIISNTADTSGFDGGSGVIMDVHTGEILAMVSYPTYNSQVMTDGQDVATIKQYLSNTKNPFLDRAVAGLYTPGSIVKPYVALGALSEGIIDPNKQIYTIGYLSIPNPYDSSKPTIFKDWKNQGSVDMRKAIEQSSDVYFYEVGGGYLDQKGLGIANIEKYVRSFGFGEAFTGIFAGPKGVIPDPEWKKQNFNGEDWRIGDTYHTAIGQYGFQVTPLQAVRAVSAVANKGTILLPTLIHNDPRETSTARHNDLVDTSFYKIVQEGMRQGVQQGTAKALDNPYVAVAGKTGTAELGITKDNVNSWVTGFFPYENPKYAFAVVLEKAHKTYPIGAPGAMGQMLIWMGQHTPEYFKD